jgi:hypothetical protein
VLRRKWRSFSTFTVQFCKLFLNMFLCVINCFNETRPTDYPFTPWVAWLYDHSILYYKILQAIIYYVITETKMERPRIPWALKEQVLRPKPWLYSLLRWYIRLYAITYCNMFAGSIFTMEVYCTQKSIHYSWLQFTTLLDF